MRNPFKTKQKPTTPTSTDHQLWRITLVIGVGEDSTYNQSGLACVIDAISTHTSVIVVSSDEDKLTMMSEASWVAITKPISAEDYATVTPPDDKPKRVRGVAVKASTRWGKLDCATVKQMHKQGRSIAEIADRVGRTPSAVRNQLQKGN